MILYENDFLTQRATYHLTTKNTSAIRMAKLLKEMGVRNNKFMLALTQPDLAEYDPHDLKDNSVELRQRIAAECKINPWYCFREVIRVPASGYIHGTPFVFNRANLFLIWSVYNSVNTYLVVPRQVTKTISTQSIVSHITYIAAMKYVIGAFAKDTSLVQQNVTRLKDIRDAYPPYLIHKSSSDTDNKEGIIYDKLGNEYMTFTAQIDPRSAENKGRGQSFGLIHIDEAAWFRYIDITYDVATGAMGAASEQALEQNLPTCVILTTTAGKTANPSGKWAYNYMLNSLRFTELLYDCTDRDHLMSMIKNNGGTNICLYGEFSWQQLGKTREWYERNTTGKSPDKIAMDYDNKWLNGADDQALPTELLNALFTIEPGYYTMKHNIIIRWYVSEQTYNSEEFKNKSFVMGLDISDNVGIDYSTMTMTDISDLAVVATQRNNTFNLTLLMYIIADLMVEFPRLLLVPERNKAGSMFIDNLILILRDKGINFQNRIYNSFVQEYNDSNDAHRTKLSNMDYNGVDRKYLGFNTTFVSRPVLYSSILIKGVSYCKDKMFDSMLINEIKGLIRKGDRIDHPPGGHDDQIISWLLGLFVVFNGRNLHMYCLDISLLLNAVDLSGKTVDPILKEEQIGIKKRIQELENKLSTCSDYLKSVIETEINQLKCRIDDDISIEPGELTRLHLERGENPTNQDDMNVLTTEISKFKSLIDMFNRGR